MAAGARVAEERNNLGLSQQELANKVTRLGYKISQTGIDKIEKRDTERPKCLKELSIALNVTENWLQTGVLPKHATAERVAEDLIKDVKQLPPDEQNTVLAQFRALLDVALKKEHKQIK